VVKVSIAAATEGLIWIAVIIVEPVANNGKTSSSGGILAPIESSWNMMNSQRLRGTAERPLAAE